MPTKSIKKILKVYNGPKIKKIKKLHFSGVKGKEVYNITAPFKYKNQTYVLGRAEEQKEQISEVFFFKKKGDVFSPDNSFNKYILEDPHLTKINELYVFSGVETKKFGNKIKYRTVFYRGKNLEQIKKFTTGPWGMKDIRLIELPNKKIGVFTRPQGKKGRRGKIGYTEISSLQELKPRKITKAKVIQHLFARGEWGGANDLLILKNGLVGVLGHAARYSKEKSRFYYPMVFVFDPMTGKTSNIRLIGRRAELPEGNAKSSDLYNVIFPGGIIRLKDGTAKLYAGVSDVDSYEIIMDDPFKYYEENLDKVVFT